MVIHDWAWGGDKLALSDRGGGINAPFQLTRMELKARSPIGRLTRNSSSLFGANVPRQSAGFISHPGGRDVPGAGAIRRPASGTISNRPATTSLSPYRYFIIRAPRPQGLAIFPDDKNPDVWVLRVGLNDRYQREAANRGSLLGLSTPGYSEAQLWKNSVKSAMFGQRFFNLALAKSIADLEKVTGPIELPRRC